jgi:UDP-3-O-[3-hydroxymyristoyl] N-acetylglucosamine deacetylase
MKETTISKAVETVGVGLHKGVPVRMRLEPAPAGNGITFVREDRGVQIPVAPHYIVDTKMATVIGKDGVVVSTIEHLMSAVYAYGIDNLRIYLDNDEVPVMDGSAIAFCMLLDEAGVRELDAPKKIMKITSPVRVESGEKFVEILPGEEMSYECAIAFEHPLIGREYFEFHLSKSAFVQQIAKARTFGFLKEVQYLRSIGLARGGSLENAIVLDEHGIVNPEGLRYKDEFVRHKVLDAIGDMSLLGKAVMGRYRAFAGGHHLHSLLTKKIIEEKAYEIVEVVPGTKEHQIIACAYASG